MISGSARTASISMERQYIFGSAPAVAPPPPSMAGVLVWGAGGGWAAGGAGGCSAVWSAVTHGECRLRRRVCGRCTAARSASNPDGNIRRRCQPLSMRLTRAVDSIYG